MSTMSVVTFDLSGINAGITLDVSFTHPANFDRAQIIAVAFTKLSDRLGLEAVPDVDEVRSYPA